MHYTLFSERHKLQELFFAERLAFSGALDFDDTAGASENEICIGIGDAVLIVIQKSASISPCFASK